MSCGETIPANCFSTETTVNQTVYFKNGTFNTLTLFYKGSSFFDTKTTLVEILKVTCTVSWGSSTKTIIELINPLPKCEKRGICAVIHGNVSCIFKANIYCNLQNFKYVLLLNNNNLYDELNTQGSEVVKNSNYEYHFKFSKSAITYPVNLGFKITNEDKKEVFYEYQTHLNQTEDDGCNNYLNYKKAFNLEEDTTASGLILTNVHLINDYFQFAECNLTKEADYNVQIFAQTQDAADNLNVKNTEWISLQNISMRLTNGKFYWFSTSTNILTFTSNSIYGNFTLSFNPKTLMSRLFPTNPYINVLQLRLMDISTKQHF